MLDQRLLDALSLSTIFSGLALLSISMLWAPGDDAVGCPRILDIFKTLTNAQDMIFKCTSLAGAIVAFTGQFRMPLNKSAARRNIFMFLILTFVAALSAMLFVPSGALLMTKMMLNSEA